MPEDSLIASRNLAGIALMTAGMASAAVVDAVIKAMSGLVDTFVITTVVGCGMALMFGIATITSGSRISQRDLVQRTVLFRTVCEVFGVYLIVLALSLVSLGEVTALSQTLPLLVTFGAVIFLGERAGPFEWIALFAGLIGMLLIVRPATDGFEPAILIALASAIVLAARDLASRAVPSSISTAQLGFWGGSALGVFSFAVVPQPI